MVSNENCMQKTRIHFSINALHPFYIVLVICVEKFMILRNTVSSDKIGKKQICQRNPKKNLWRYPGETSMQELLKKSVKNFWKHPSKIPVRIAEAISESTRQYSVKKFMETSLKGNPGQISGGITAGTTSGVDGTNVPNGRLRASAAGHLIGLCHWCALWPAFSACNRRL